MLNTFFEVSLFTVFNSSERNKKKVNWFAGLEKSGIFRFQNKRINYKQRVTQFQYLALTMIAI